MNMEKLLAALREEDGLGVVRVEDVYATDIRDLWSAVTEPNRLVTWIADVEGDLHVGGEFRATFTSGWSGTGSVEVCDAPRLLRVRTQQPGEPSTVMEAQLTPEGDGTRLVIEERGLPLGEYADHGAGWQAHAEDLHAHIDRTVPNDWTARWRELSVPYRALLQPVRTKTLQQLDHSFTTTLVGDMGPHKWTCAVLDDSRQILGTGKPVKVRADIDGVSVTTSLLPYRDRHMLPVKQAILDQINKAAGDAVTITLTSAQP